MISILTPTYNRKNTLSKLYDSLVKQTSKNFEWVIVDDGSTDATDELIQSFILEKKIAIKFFYKKNGGKHTAINYGVNKIKGDAVLIVDSDDYLLPYAIEYIVEYKKKYFANKKIGALSFLRVNSNYQTIGKIYKGNEIISNNIDFRYNKGFLGDMAEVYKTSILKQYPFPVFENENYLSEAIIWNKIALNYDTVYINDGIYVTEYLKDGLTFNSLLLRYKNPIGAAANANLFLNKKFKNIIRMKNAILYNCFSLLAKNKKMLKEGNSKLLIILFFLPGLLLFILLKFKYKKLEK